MKDEFSVFRTERWFKTEWYSWNSIGCCFCFSYFFSALVTVECMHAGVCGSASQASAVLQLLGYGFSWWRGYWSQGVPDMETGSQYLEHPVITNLISNRD